ncbi:protein longifolia 1 [Quercus suber]|uniref:Protein longifolia 1 n=1 Tax=Quercus suber TaxID=58331 RepID=A0AAW0KLP5_QUESU
MATGIMQEQNKLEKHIDKQMELEKQQQARSAPSPERPKQQSQLPELRSPMPESATPSETPPPPTKSPLPFPVFELKEGTKSSWKFSREAPRLSLDSRAVVDAKGSLKPREIRTKGAFLSSNRCEAVESDKQSNSKSPSVIARLMGLESLKDSDPEPVKKAELRRSASESRVSRDLFQYGNNFNFQVTRPTNQNLNSQSNNASNNAIRENVGYAVANETHRFGDRPVRNHNHNVKTEAARTVSYRGMAQRKSFFDSADFFPEQAKRGVSIYGEIERRLRMRGIEEPFKDLDTSKHILEALQLKGLLHSKKAKNQMSHQNFVYDRNGESPIVVMKPARSPANRISRGGNESPPSSFRSRPGPRRNTNEVSPAVSPRRDWPEMDRNGRYQARGRNANSPTRSESNVRSPSRRRIDSVENRRVSPVQSPKISARRIGSSDQPITSRSPRMKKATAEIFQKDDKAFSNPAEDESYSSTTVSESSISTSSQTDIERLKVEECKEGRSLLERCDKLLHSIAEITATELQPNQPVELEDDIWSLAMSSLESKSDDCDFVYISEILRASIYLPEDADIFLLLEKQQYLKGKDTSKVSRLQRRLIFDTINEILDRNGQLPPWKPNSWTSSASLQQIWSEFQRIQERDESEDLFEVICGVLRKDLVMGDTISGWVDCPIEMSEAVLDIERLIFKDLIGETIGDLAVLSGDCNKVSALRRKLVF